MLRPRNNTKARHISRFNLTHSFVRKICLLGVFLFGSLASPSYAANSVKPQTLHVAVASNFLFPLKQLAELFQQESGIIVIASSGSTGTLFAQISNGAPFDIFLSADERRPRILVEKHLALKNSRMTYAHGQLILWGNDRKITPEKNSDSCLTLLKNSGRLAIANPQTAPYGTAARESLQALGLWDDIQSRVVYGNTVAHSYQFVDTGNVDFGIVALSEYRRLGQKRPGCSWAIPANLHSPLIQQAVILKRTDKKTDAQRFMTFLSGKIARHYIAEIGYGIP